jgi:ATP-binding cassette subfamily F protein 3
MLHVHNITIRYGGQEVLNEVTFFVGPKERVGLVGDNGAGKTTLLEIIAGRRSADDGFVKLDPHNTLGYLSQESQCRLGITLEEEMLSAFPGVLAARAELARLQDEMDAVAASGDLDAIDRLVEAMAETQDEYDRLDGYTVDARVGEVLHGLGFAQDDRPRLTDEFSGGWQMRIALAKLLVSQPPLLLLDEPTNHIDKAARDWLEGYLDGYRGSLVVVSHDTALLDNVARRIIELEDNVATSYTGNYSDYLRLKAERRRHHESAYRRQQKLIRRQQTYIERFRAIATRAAQVKARERQLERLERVEPPKPEPKSIDFRFLGGGRGSREIITFKNVTKAYDDLVVLRDVSFTLERADRVALVGPNGAGKTTLLRLLAGAEEPTSGAVILGNGTRAGFYAQHQAEALDPNKTVLAEALGASRTGSTAAAMNVLGRFLLADDAHKQVRKLSGGERSRLALAKMLLRPANLLLLDEPTNHLDRRSTAMLEAALLDYAGTVVVATHDLSFLTRVATKVATFENGEVTVRLADRPLDGTEPTPARRRRSRAATAKQHKSSSQPAARREPVAVS